MVSPIDYRLDVLNPVQQAMQGYNFGTQMAVNQNAIQAAQAEEARKQQQFIAQQEQQKAMYDFSMQPNKTTQDFVDFTVRYPQLTDQYKKSWEMMDTGQRAESLKTAAQVMSAIKTQNPRVAQDILEEQAKAYENSGQRESAFNMRRMKGMISKDPNSIYASLGLFGNAVSPDEFGAMMDKFGAGVRADQMQPYEIEESKSKTANNYSQITDRQEGRKLQKEEMYLNDDRYYAGLDQNEKQFWAKMNADERSAARAMAEKPETTTERLARLEKVNGYAGAVAQAKDAAENAARLAKLADSNGGAYWDRLVANIPGTSENTFRKDVETLKSQVFLTQIEQMRGLGALTESEGAALKSSIASLDLNQGATSFKNNLNKISLVLNRAAKKAEKNAELYATKGKGYSEEVVQAAKQRGISPAEMQTIANELGW